MSYFIARNLTKIEEVAGCTFACICNTVFRMFSCLQINCRPFYLRQLLKFHLFDWLIEIYLQTEGQGTHHKMVSLQPMPGFSLLLCHLRTTVPLVSYIKNSLRFWYYASLSTCCQNLEKIWGHRKNLGESGGQTFKGSDREKCQF